MTTIREDRPIRPTPAELQGPTTLDVMTGESFADPRRRLIDEPGIDLRLELKLETPDKKYWLCTRGVAGPNPDVPQVWIVGNAIVEYPDGDMFAYSPEQAVELQRIDYQGILMRDLERLCDLYEQGPTNEIAGRLKEIREELQGLLPPDLRDPGD